MCNNYLYPNIIQKTLIVVANVKMMLSLHNKRSTRAVQGEPPHVSSIEHAIYCPETQFMYSCCNQALNYCSSAPQFDISAAKNDQGLIGLLGLGRGGGASAVDSKFSELHEKLRSCHVGPFYWMIPSLAFCMGIIVLITYLESMHLPGDYDSSKMNATLKIMFAITSIIILLAGFLYAWVKSRKIGPIVEDHFMDWKEFGVEVSYRSPKIIIEEGNCGKKGTQRRRRHYHYISHLCNSITFMFIIPK